MESIRFFFEFTPAINRKYPKLEILSNGLYIKKIEKKITKARKYKNYDIEIEGNHNFFANGCLVHNCIVDLISPLPNYIETPIREKLQSLLPKNLYVNKIPFNTIRQEIKKLYKIGE